MPGNVSLPVAISADEPLFIKTVGMLRNAREVYRFICTRLLCHDLAALFAVFTRHCFLLHHLYEMRYTFDYTLDVGFEL
jgi:hypothetical protein